MVDEPSEIVSVGVETRLEPLVALAPEAQRARRQVEDENELLARPLVHPLHRGLEIREVLEDVPAQHRVEGPGQLGELVKRAFAKTRRVGREALARRRDELRSDVDAEIVQIGSPLAEELEHDAGAAADVEHGAHALQELERLETRRMLAPFVAHAEEIADLGGREASPGFLDPHRASLMSFSCRAAARPQPAEPVARERDDHWPSRSWRIHASSSTGRNSRRRRSRAPEAGPGRARRLATAPQLVVRAIADVRQSETEPAAHTREPHAGRAI